MKRNVRGFTILEISLSLAVVMGLIAALTVYYVRAESQARSQQYIDQATELVAFIQKRYPTGDFSGLSTTTLLAEPGLNPAWISGTSLLAPDKRSITVAPLSFADRGQASNSQFGLTYTMSIAQCVDVARRLDGLANAGLWIHNAWVRQRTQTVTPIAIVTACNAGGGETVSVQIAVE